MEIPLLQMWRCRDVLGSRSLREAEAPRARRNSCNYGDNRIILLFPQTAPGANRPARRANPMTDTPFSDARSPSIQPLADAAGTALLFDPEKFREHVQDMDLSTKQQDALLEAVWLIVVGVIDLGLGFQISSAADAK